MKDFLPVGCTRTPKPVTLSSQAIQGLAAASSASITGMVRFVRSFAVRLPVSSSIDNRWRNREFQLPDRARRDLVLMEKIKRVFETNYSVYGPRKVWRQLRREGQDVARCTVERLMRDLGLAGAIRGKPVKTTVSDKGAACPLDKVNRQCSATSHLKGQRHCR